MVDQLGNIATVIYLLMGAYITLAVIGLLTTRRRVPVRVRSLDRHHHAHDLDEQRYAHDQSEEPSHSQRKEP